jgi:hypothetical protein
MEEGFCAPHRIHNFKKTGSCLTLEEAKEIAKLHSKKTGTKVKINDKSKVTDIINEILKKLQDPNCKGEHCLLKHKDYAKHLDDIFRPLKPDSWYTNEREWLSTDDILNVMKQYESSHSDFAFVDVCPINFAEQLTENKCVSPTICNVEPFMRSIIEKKKNHFGIVFNLDRHDQSGSHWVAIYCNLDPKGVIYGIYYYDSVGVMPKDEFKEFMTKVQEFVHNNINNKRHFTKQVNKHRRQYKNTECGVYSMVSIISCMENRYNKHFRKVCMEIKDDDQTHKLRKILYTPLK